MGCIHSRMDDIEESNCGLRNGLFENTKLDKTNDKQMNSNKLSEEFGTAL